VNAADHDQHLPPTVGGLIGFALRSWAADAPFYVALALIVFCAYALVEWTIPAAPLESDEGVFKLYALMYTGVFADAYITAAVALGVAARGLGTPLAPRTLAGGALERWLPVIAVSVLAQGVIILTGPLANLMAPPEPRWLIYFTTPLIWVLWGILGLTGPFVALAQTRTASTVLIGFAHAFAVALRPTNLSRLCILALITVVPELIALILQQTLQQHHVARSIFWAEIPVDVLSIGPLSAIQTAFALDFVRRTNLDARARP